MNLKIDLTKLHTEAANHAYEYYQARKELTEAKAALENAKLLRQELRDVVGKNYRTFSPNKLEEKTSVKKVTEAALKELVGIEVGVKKMERAVISCKTTYDEANDVVLALEAKASMLVLATKLVMQEGFIGHITDIAVDTTGSVDSSDINEVERAENENARRRRRKTEGIQGQGG